MKRIFAMSLIQTALISLLTTSLNLAASAAPTAPVSDNIYNYLQLLRSDVNSAKVELVNRIMKLSAEDAKKFWPIYRDYENELGKLAINRAELIAEFVQSEGKVATEDWLLGINLVGFTEGDNCFGQPYSVVPEGLAETVHCSTAVGA